jgi:hypothetical protein
MDELFNDLTIDNFPYLINYYLEDGTTWQEAASEQWGKLSYKYDFSAPQDEPTEAAVVNALEKEDYLLATKLAIHCPHIEPLEFSIENDSPKLLYYLISYFSIHGYVEGSKKWNIWTQVNSSALLAKAVKFRSEKCFLLLLTFNDIEAIQEDDSDIVHRTLDWLLQPKYKYIAQYHKLGKQSTARSHYSGELVNMDLFAAFALERKFDLAESLIIEGWEDINPYIENYPETLLESAINQAKVGKRDLLEWYLSIIGSCYRYTQQMLEPLTEYSSEIRKLIPDLNQRVDTEALENAVCENISNNCPSHAQLEYLQATSALSYAPVRQGGIQPAPQNISIFHDIKRIHEHLLKPNVTDFRICLIRKHTLSVTVFEYGESTPKCRALVDCLTLEAFRRMLRSSESEGTYPTDFQIQLAFLSMTEQELIQHVLTQLEPAVH